MGSYQNRIVVKKAYIKYLIALLLFGSNGIVASRISLNSCEIVLLRTLIGSLLLMLIFLLQRKPFDFIKHKKDLIFLVISSIAMGASWMFLYEAYKQVGVSLASLAYYCGPIIVMILSPVIFHEKFIWPQIAGFLCVLIGIFLVNGQAIQDGNRNLGLICGAMSAIMYALMIIFNKKVAKITGFENSLLQLTISFLTVAIFVGTKQGFAMSIASSDWVPIFILGIINTGIGCFLYFSSIGFLSVHTVAVCGYLEPLSAVVFSVIFLQEKMQQIQIIGAVMILGGAVFGEVFKKNKRIQS